MLSKLDNPHPLESLRVPRAHGSTLGKQREPQEKRAKPPSLLTLYTESHLLSLLSSCFCVLILALGSFLLVILSGGRPMWMLPDARGNFIFQISMASRCWESSKFLKLAALPQDAL